jgi:hypothetical protein
VQKYGQHSFTGSTSAHFFSIHFKLTDAFAGEFKCGMKAEKYCISFQLKFSLRNWVGSYELP